MIVAFVLTFYWPHIKSPPRGNFTTLGAPLSQQQTDLLPSSDGRGSLTASGCAHAHWSPGTKLWALGRPFHPFTRVAAAHTRRLTRSGPAARPVNCLTPICAAWVPWVQLWGVTQNFLFLTFGFLGKGEVRDCQSALGGGGVGVGDWGWEVFRLRGPGVFREQKFLP